MIGHNHLGKNGRFGNQMFQYAATRGIAAKHNYDWCIPDGPKTDDEFEDEIRKDFEWRDDVKKLCQDMFDSIGGKAISLHIRRTDHLIKPTQHPVLPLSYYEFEDEENQHKLFMAFKMDGAKKINMHHAT